MNRLVRQPPLPSFGLRGRFQHALDDDIMIPITTPPGRARQIAGRGLAFIGFAVIGSTAIYFALNLLQIANILAVVLGSFAVCAGGMIGSIGLLIGGSAATTRRLGCIGAIVFSVPTALVVAFLVFSLFNTARTEPSSNSAARRLLEAAVGTAERPTLGCR
ncbi:MAG TPA: hypothetical protein VEK79_10725 [Thermoanaerobaculia bacterium]|nr:hypothetical protein [Thermoanaerobaculia bacterium]